MTSSFTKAVYLFTRDYIQQHQGFPPSIREIARGAYLAPSTVIRHLDRLEAWGLIERQPNTARGIRLIADEWPDGRE